MKMRNIRIILGILIPVLILMLAYIYDPYLSKKSLEFSDKAIHWYALIPPLIAVSLALTTRRILLSLLVAIVSGVSIIHNFQPITVARETVTNYLWGNFANEFSMLFVLFVFLLIGMISIINRGGGTLGVVNFFAKAVRGARSACIATVAMGFAIFFDDYTNTIIVGTTMRNLTDKMRVSREKLAYLVDSTTAPIAGIALISTWIGFEVEQLQHITESQGLGLSGYALFLQMLPYRYYCIFTIFFVIAIALSRRDFGPMLKAERRTWFKGLVSRPNNEGLTSMEFAESHVKENIPHRAVNAVIPVLTVILCCISGILYLGSQGSAMHGVDFNLFSMTCWYKCFIGIGQVENGIPIVLCLSALMGTLFASVLFLTQRILNFKDIFKALFKGWKIIFVVAGLLVLAWSIRQICDEMGTAYYILSAVHGSVSPHMLALAIFFISSVIAFSTGTSWGTMGILFPILAPVAAVYGDISFVVISMSAVLDGAIFGDHCSPISDTTILSSISSNCDHIDHVRTQMPYALVTAAIAGLAGYIPASLGLPVVATYMIGAVLIFSVIFFIAKPIASKKKNALSTDHCSLVTKKISGGMDV